MQSTYTRNQSVIATYTCSNPVTSHLGQTQGPYLVAATCKQASGTQTQCTQTATGITCTGTVDTTHSRILQPFTVTTSDSGGNLNINAVIYNVK